MLLINGQPDGTIDPRDRGLHYGDGLFETLSVRDGRARHWQRHMGRLARGCQRLGMRAPDFALLAREAQQLCERVERGVLKILWTRGPGGRGYAPWGAEDTTRMLALHPAPQYPPSFAREGITARWCRYRMGHNPELAGIKHINRLDQVLARAEWQDPDIAEGLVCDLVGNVVSGTMSNLFLVEQGALRTPGLELCGVAGITRERLLEHAVADGIPCAVSSVTPQQLLDADEVFLCNSVNGIWQVRTLENRQWPPGELCRHLAARIEAD